MVKVGMSNSNLSVRLSIDINDITNGDRMDILNGLNDIQNVCAKYKIPEEEATKELLEGN